MFHARSFYRGFDVFFFVCCMGISHCRIGTRTLCLVELDIELHDE